MKLTRAVFAFAAANSTMRAMKTKKTHPTHVDVTKVKSFIFKVRPVGRGDKRTGTVAGNMCGWDVRLIFKATAWSRNSSTIQRWNCFYCRNVVFSWSIRNKTMKEPCNSFAKRDVVMMINNKSFQFQ
jgi:hypothetical protein